MTDFLNITIWNNTLADYMIFLGSLALSIGVLTIIRKIAIKKLIALTKRTPSSLDDILVNTLKKHIIPVLYFGALFLSLKWLTINDTISEIAQYAMIAIASIFGALIASSILIFILNKFLEKREEKARSIKWIAVLVKILIWVIALLMFLDNIGVQITTLVASLGIGGIAIAFAAQAVLQDLFSFVSIFFDRPFEIDDFIVVGDLLGTVEHIGIKTTRLRSLSGEQLVFSNNDLTNSRIRNYKRMENRRIQFTIGVTYNTSPETLREIPDIIKNIILSIDRTTFDRAHFREFGDFSLNFEVVYYVLSQDYNVYMDIQHAINLNIKKTFDEKGIAFAFPTQTIYLKKS